MTLTKAVMSKLRIIELKLSCHFHRAETTIKPETKSKQPQNGGESVTFSILFSFHGNVRYRCPSTRMLPI